MEKKRRPPAPGLAAPLDLAPLLPRAARRTARARRRRPFYLPALHRPSLHRLASLPPAAEGRADALLRSAGQICGGRRTMGGDGSSYSSRADPARNAANRLRLSRSVCVWRWPGARELLILPGLQGPLSTGLALLCSQLARAALHLLRPRGRQPPGPRPPRSGALRFFLAAPAGRRTSATRAAWSVAPSPMEVSTTASSVEAAAMAVCRGAPCAPGLRDGCERRRQPLPPRAGPTLSARPAPLSPPSCCRRGPTTCTWAPRPTSASRTAATSARFPVRGTPASGSGSYPIPRCGVFLLERGTLKG
ncbi:hypothetical protein C2845_PM03G13300 [Panicum miliaceum]|uniref:Uncharacterized protein n=1 Tax=Panicum miliaceum TaxID=4540 RepID=A0A3L6TAQ1_PANMI|nr:hypothetical protein C2845_PM03G13300 [Panicum miliaceum]